MDAASRAVYPGVPSPVDSAPPRITVFAGSLPGSIAKHESGLE